MIPRLKPHDPPPGVRDGAVPLGARMEPSKATAQTVVTYWFGDDRSADPRAIADLYNPRCLARMPKPMLTSGTASPRCASGP